jgi:glycerol-3-phosphate acyltransferase PlsY
LEKIFFVLKFNMDEKVLLMIIFAYLLGSINPAIMLTNIFSKRDIRELGDENPGATNVFLNVNKFAGALVFSFDSLKGFLPPLFASLIGLTGVLPALIGSFAVIGHDFPLFHRFKGGTGISAIIGGLLFFMPRLIILTVIFVTFLVFLFSYKGFSLNFRLSPFESGESIAFIIVIVFLIFSENIEAKMYMLFSTLIVVIKKFDVALDLLKINHQHIKI